MTIRLLLVLLFLSTAAAPAPGVKGTYKEVNTGNFDLVDGLAYASVSGMDTIIYVTSKPIASQALSESICGLARARSLVLLRNAGALSIEYDGDRQATYFEAGTPYGGSSIQMSNLRAVSISGGKEKRGRVAGTLKYKGRGKFDFDLPSTKHRVTKGQDIVERKVTKEELLATYAAVRRAAIAKDLPAMLAAQGFEAKQIAAIRALPGIDAELAALADRFFDPGTPEEPSFDGERAKVGSRGVNSKGKKFINYYEFTPCGNKLLLISIAEN